MARKKNKHYFSRFPDTDLKIQTVSESLRRHMYIFKTTTGVFSYSKIDLGTQILIDYMIIPKGNRTLLDLGCGYGPVGMVLGYESPQSQVYMVDVNRRAVWCAKENIKINIRPNEKRVVAFSGNFLEPFQKKNIMFDAIYTNPPVRLGREVFLNLVKEIKDQLKPDGFFEFVIRKKMGASYLEKKLGEMFPNEPIQILGKKSGYWAFHCFEEGKESLKKAQNLEK